MQFTDQMLLEHRRGARASRGKRVGDQTGVVGVVGNHAAPEQQTVAQVLVTLVHPVLEQALPARVRQTFGGQTERIPKGRSEQTANNGILARADALCRVHVGVNAT